MGTSRREFLSEVGGGMLIASLGPALASELGLVSAVAAEPPTGLTFGKLEPLVALMQTTAPDKLMPILTEKLRNGTTLEQLTAAAALANARTFGGEDYIGFHTMMALVPAYQMARELPESHRPLPVMKVLFRNSHRLQEKGGDDHEVLHHVAPAQQATPDALREAARKKDMASAEALYAKLAASSPYDALNNLLPMVHDATEVHRVVMVWRAWSLLDFVGREQAHTLLRQSVHYCVSNESPGYAKGHGGLRELLPKLLEQHGLLGKPLGTRTADDTWVEGMVQTLFKLSPDKAAEAVAVALAEGMAPDAISEAISLAANQLVLRDEGRPEKWASPNKPAGSVHGDSVGVHACDAVNAWCNIARVANPRNAAASLILAGYEVARDRVTPMADMAQWKARPFEADTVKVKATDPKALLDETESAIRNKDQFHALAAVARYGYLGHSERPVLDLMLKYAISEDGALHAEKYYRTAAEEFARTRPAFRWRQLAALARVTASAYGYAAPGYDQCKELLKAT